MSNETTFSEYERERSLVFWTYVDKKAEDDCWLWKGQMRRNGYGYFKMEKGKKVLSHRLALLFAKGERPHGNAVVRHLCGNRSCCNPNHLKYGTYVENSIDTYMMNHGRQSFSPNEVVEYRKRYAKHELTEVEIARLKNVDVGIVGSMIRGYSYSYLPGAVKEARGFRKRKLSFSQIREIRTLYPKINGVQLAKRFGVSPNSIYAIIHHKTYRSLENVRSN